MTGEPIENCTLLSAEDLETLLVVHKKYVRFTQPSHISGALAPLFDRYSNRTDHRTEGVPISETGSSMEMSRKQVALT